MQIIPSSPPQTRFRLPIGALILACLVCAYSCAANRSYYRMIVIDTHTFNYNIIMLRAEGGQKLIMISPKFDSLQNKPAPAGFEELKLDSSYELSLREYRTPPPLEVMLPGRLSEIRDYYVDDGTSGGDDMEDSTSLGGFLLWADREFTVSVYKSDDVLDKFVRLKRQPAYCDD